MRAHHIWGRRSRLFNWRLAVDERPKRVDAALPRPRRPAGCYTTYSVLHGRSQLKSSVMRAEAP